MQLSKRLQMVAAQVLSGGVLADIGCDHGFTSIYLVSGGQVSRAIAMDVREGPLERAAEHVAESGLQEHSFFHSATCFFTPSTVCSICNLSFIILYPCIS